MKSLDIGCGIQKRGGFIGIDKVPSSQADYIVDIVKDKFPFDDNTFDNAFCGDVIEHLTWHEMIHVLNEAWRVLKPGSILEIATLYGVDGWLAHATHVRPIMPNQFDYFQPSYLEHPTHVHMRKADGIIAVFEVIGRMQEKDLLNFKLKVIKK